MELAGSAVTCLSGDVHGEIEFPGMAQLHTAGLVEGR